MDEKELQLFRELQKENVWWQTNSVPANLARDFKRSDYFVYKELLDNNKINVIIGPRRVGKSTIIYQLIQYLTKEKKVPSKRILFLSLERPFFEITKNPITESIKVYEENILKESIHSSKESIYLFIDEASRNSEWAVTLKQFFDLKYNMKYFVSGSSSPALYQKSSESLVGRKNDVLMLPLKFRDVLRFKYPIIEKNLQIGTGQLREKIKDAINNNNPKVFYELLLKLYTTINPSIETDLHVALNEYLLRGGYPEFYDVHATWEESSRIMREAYFEAIISYDILKVFGTRNPENLKKLYIILALNTADIINMSNIKRDLGNISRTALDDYFYQLQETHLISTSLLYKKSRRKIGNELKKVYIHDTGMRNAVLGISEQDIKQPDLLGALAESVAHNHLRRLKFCIEPDKKNELFFWRDAYKRELDVILELRGKIIPIEIKFQETIRSEDIKVLKATLKKFNSPFGILLTKKSFQLKDNIISVPLWLFLLVC